MTDRPAPEAQDAPNFEIRERATDVLKIVDAEGEALVTIAPDGNVTIHNDADVNDAARIFWAAVQQEIWRAVPSPRNQRGVLRDRGEASRPGSARFRSPGVTDLSESELEAMDNRATAVDPMRWWGTNETMQTMEYPQMAAHVSAADVAFLVRARDVLTLVAEVRRLRALLAVSLSDPQSQTSAR